MRNVSIKTKILAWVLVVNIVGAAAIAIYLHESFSGGLDVTARRDVELTKGAWEDITSHGGDKASFATYAQQGPQFVARMKAITGADYGLLLQKDGGDAKAYEAALKARKAPNNWSEGDVYALAATTSDAYAARMQLKASADAVPDIGKVVGIENGACAKTCHGSVKGSGDFWGVSWSPDSGSRAHAVIPVLDAGGKPVGLLYSIDDISTQADADRTSLIRTLVVIGVGLAIATVIISFLLSTLVFKRLTNMMETMEDLSVRVAGGDFDAHFVPDGASDEIGQFEEFFAKFLDLVSSMLKSLLAKSA